MDQLQGSQCHAVGPWGMFCFRTRYLRSNLVVCRRLGVRVSPRARRQNTKLLSTCSHNASKSKSVTSKKILRYNCAIGSDSRASHASQRRAAQMVEKNPWWRNVSGPFLTWQGPVGIKEDGGGCTRGHGRVGSMIVHRACCNRDLQGRAQAFQRSKCSHC